MAELLHDGELVGVVAGLHQVAAGQVHLLVGTSKKTAGGRRKNTLITRTAA